MSVVITKTQKEKLIEQVSILPYRDVKELINALLQKKLYRPTSSKIIYKEASAVARNKKLSPQVAEEAVQWAREKK